MHNHDLRGNLAALLAAGGINKAAGLSSAACSRIGCGDPSNQNA